MPGSSSIVVAGHDVRVLVRLQPDAVAGAVDEQLAVAGRLDDVAGGRVDAGGGDARPGPVARRLLRRLQHLVEREEVGAGVADGVRPGRVRAVAGRHRAADVDDHRLAGPDDPVGQLVVRAGAVRPGRDDGEVHASRARRRGSRRRCPCRPRPRCVPASATAAPGRARRRSRPPPRAAPPPPPPTCACAARAGPGRPGAGRSPGIASRRARTLAAHMWSSRATAAAPREQPGDQR